MEKNKEKKERNLSELIVIIAAIAGFLLGVVFCLNSDWLFILVYSLVLVMAFISSFD